MRIKSYSPVCSRFNGCSCKEIFVKCHIHVCLNEHNLLTRKFHISFDKFGLQGVLCVFLKIFLTSIHTWKHCLSLLYYWESLQRSKLGFYDAFNSQVYLGTGPQHCHLWALNPHRGDCLWLYAKSVESLQLIHYIVSKEAIY